MRMSTLARACCTCHDMRTRTNSTALLLPNPGPQEPYYTLSACEDLTIHQNCKPEQGLLHLFHGRIPCNVNMSRPP